MFSSWKLSPLTFSSQKEPCFLAKEEEEASPNQFAMRQICRKQEEEALFSSPFFFLHFKVRAFCLLFAAEKKEPLFFGIFQGKQNCFLGGKKSPEVINFASAVELRLLLLSSNALHQLVYRKKSIWKKKKKKSVGEKSSQIKSDVRR